MQDTTIAVDLAKSVFEVAVSQREGRVAKRERGGRTWVDVERLDEAGRVEEIARMAGGEKITEATRRHARELLAAARGGGVKARGRRSDS